MLPARAIFMVVLVAALAAYSLDCFAASTPDEAMQCCDSMPCPQHSHDGSEDCCQTMPSLNAPFVQPHVLDIASHAPVVLAVAPSVAAPQAFDLSAHVLVAEHS